MSADSLLAVRILEQAQASFPTREAFASFRAQVLERALGRPTSLTDPALLSAIDQVGRACTPDELASDLAGLEEILFGPEVDPDEDFSA